MSRSNDWHRIKEIFSQAIELDVTKQDLFIEKTCSDNPDLKKEVLSLLAASRKPSIIDRSIAPLTSDVFETKNMDGKKIGAYKVLREIDHGGMGTVYLAERDDGHFEQKVALKLLKNGFSTDEQISRFKAERQILATLQHDHIAHLLDGGITKDGQPWFAMEYVHGQPINVYCNEQRLSIDERLSLFLDVCNAVQYAHQKLIIHRDLKPNNILVTENGSIKLLDFGIAKVLNSNSHPDYSESHSLEPNLLTPSFASPEQIQSRPVTVSSDVYQLGLVLYNLLTGVHPYDIEGDNRKELEEIICDSVPDHPSRLLSSQTVASELRMNQSVNKAARVLQGDLDAIILKAIHKKPEDRYQSVGEFSADLKRFIKGYPVKARPDSFFYRTQKLVLRNKISASAISIILTMILVYAFTITRHSHQIESAFNRIQQEADKSEQVVSYLLEMFNSGDPTVNPGETITANTLLKRGLEKAEQLENQPHVQAQMYDVIGRAYRELGEYERALTPLQNALNYWENNSVESKAVLADAYYNMGTVLHHLGNYGESDSYFNRAVELYGDIPGHQSSEYAGSLYTLAEMKNIQKDYDTAEKFHRKALEMRQNLSTSVSMETVSSYRGLSTTLLLAGKSDEARKLIVEAIDLFQSNYDKIHPEMAGLLESRAMIFQQTGEPDQAEDDLLEALQIKTDIYGSNHTETGITKKALADLYRSVQNFELAEQLYSEILQEIDHNSDYAHHPLQRPVLQALSKLYMETGDYRSAEPTLRETVSLLESVLNPEHPRLISANRDLGVCLTYLEKFAEAESYLLKTLITSQNLTDSTNGYQHQISESLEALIVLYEQWGISEKATAYTNQLANLN